MSEEKKPYSDIRWHCDLNSYDENGNIITIGEKNLPMTDEEIEEECKQGAKSFREFFKDDPKKAEEMVVMLCNPEKLKKRREKLYGEDWQAKREEIFKKAK